MTLASRCVLPTAWLLVLNMSAVPVVQVDLGPHWYSVFVVVVVSASVVIVSGQLMGCY